MMADKKFMLEHISINIFCVGRPKEVLVKGRHSYILSLHFFWKYLESRRNLSRRNLSKAHTDIFALKTHTESLLKA